MSIQSQAYADLQNMGTTIASADDLLAKKRWENATQAYQVAGTQGQSLRSELVPGVNLDQADALNQTLQALQWHLASQATADQAGVLAKQILALYTASYNASPPSNAPIVATTPAAVVSPQAPTKSWADYALWGVVGVGVAAILFFALKGPARENPSGMASTPRRSKKKALIAKGRSVAFDMKDGSSVRCSGGMLHDPSGRWWPRNSVLCGPFRVTRKADDDEVSGEARHYLGSSHNTKMGSVNTPPKALGEWKYIGEVEEIWYVRTGKKRPGTYFHPFSKPGALATILKGKGKARLYKRGNFCRLDLPRGAILDSRGYVWP